jgi:hypothetical protein
MMKGTLTVHVWRESIHDDHRGDKLKGDMVRHPVLSTHVHKGFQVMWKAGRNWKILSRGANEIKSSSWRRGELLQRQVKERRSMHHGEKSVRIYSLDTLQSDFFVQDLSESAEMFTM